MDFYNKIYQLYRRLFPTGRAFNIPYQGFFDNVITGLSYSTNRLASDSQSILDSLLPDNDNFSEDDATQWEKRLGMITNTSVSLEDRKLAILRKLAFPNNIPARMPISWLESQLQAAGFNVYAYENLDNLSPYDVSGSVEILSDYEHGEFEHGEIETGEFYNNVIANFLPEGADDGFNDGGSFRSSIIIGGNTRGSFASVDVNRKNEFRQLILKLKGTSKIAYLFINYTY